MCIRDRGNGDGGEHEAGGDDYANESGCGCGCSEPKHDDAENQAEAEGPDGDRWNPRCPKVGLEQRVGRGKWDDQQQNQFGLPGNFALSHASW